MNLSMLDRLLNVFDEKFDIGKKRVVTLLKDELLENGTKVMLEGVEIYTKYFKFNTDDDCMFADSYDKPYNDINFLDFEEKDIWALIYGEFIARNKISDIEDFGVTKVDTSL